MNYYHIARALIFLLVFTLGLIGLFLAEHHPTWKAQERTWVHRSTVEYPKSEIKSSHKSLLTFEKQNAGAPSLAQIFALTDDPDRVFESIPLSPVDWAVTLRRIQAKGIKHLAILPQMSWPEPSEITISSLEASLAPFSSVTLGLDLSQKYEETPPPKWLQESLLKPAQIQGDLSRLLQVNHIETPPATTSLSNISYGFVALENRNLEDPFAPFPLLVRWGDALVPSFPLMARMKELGLSPAEIKGTLGEILTLGDSGITMPLDLNGCYPQVAPPRNLLPPLALESLILSDDEQYPTQKAWIVDRSQHSSSRGPLSQPGVLEASLLSMGNDISSKPLYYYTPLGLTFNLYLLFSFTLLTTLFVTWPIALRVLAHLCCLTFLMVLFVTVARFGYHWHLALPHLIVLSSGFVLSLFTRFDHEEKVEKKTARPSKASQTRMTRFETSGIIDLNEPD